MRGRMNRVKETARRRGRTVGGDGKKEKKMNGAGEK